MDVGRRLLVPLFNVFGKLRMSVCLAVISSGTSERRTLIRVVKVTKLGGIAHLTYEQETWISGRVEKHRKLMALQEFLKEKSIGRGLAQKLFTLTENLVDTGRQ